MEEFRIDKKACNRQVAQRAVLFILAALIVYAMPDTTPASVFKGWGNARIFHSSDIVFVIIIIAAGCIGLIQMRSVLQSFKLNIDERQIKKSQNGMDPVVIPLGNITRIEKYPNGSYIISGADDKEGIRIPPGLHSTAIEEHLNAISPVIEQENMPFPLRYTFARDLIILLLGLLFVVALRIDPQLFFFAGILLLAYLSIVFVQMRAVKYKAKFFKLYVYNLIAIGILVLIVMALGVSALM